MAYRGNRPPDLTPYFNVTGDFLSTPTVALVGNSSFQVRFTPAPVPEAGWVVAACAVAVGTWHVGRRFSRENGVLATRQQAGTKVGDHPARAAGRGCRATTRASTLSTC
jgi:hypothetical protein